MMDRFDQALDFITAAKLDVVKGDLKGGNCIQHSLVVRDFLHSIGFAATIRSVVIYLRAEHYGVELWSVCCGMKVPAVVEPAGGGWDGHLVVESNGVLIDPTFYQFRRPAWGWIDDVAMVRVVPKEKRTRSDLYGLKKPVIAAVARSDDKGYEFSAVWIANPGNAGWHHTPSARLDRRKPIVQVMVEKFKSFKGN